MNVSYLHPICCKGINNLKHTNLSKLYVKSYNVRVELPLFFSMASEGMRSKVCDFQAPSAHLEYS